MRKLRDTSLSFEKRLGQEKSLYRTSTVPSPLLVSCIKALIWTRSKLINKSLKKT
jgi:hypothetical protein